MLQLPHHRDAALAQGRRGQDRLQRMRSLVSCLPYYLPVHSNHSFFPAATNFTARLAPFP